MFVYLSNVQKCISFHNNKPLLQIVKSYFCKKKNITNFYLHLIVIQKKKRDKKFTLTH